MTVNNHTVYIERGDEVYIVVDSPHTHTILYYWYDTTQMDIIVWDMPPSQLYYYFGTGKLQSSSIY